MLEIKGIDSGYGKIKVLKDITLKIEKGEMVALVGPNGAGKTTLLKTIAGMIVPSKGDILLEETSISGMPPHKTSARGIAYVPEGRRVFSAMSVEENLLMGTYLKKNRPHKTESLRMVYDLFPRLEERKKQTAGTLSGGEQQMLAIGRGLMMRPKLVLLDEPSLGLAPLLINSIYKVLERLNGEGMTTLLVEQNVKKALSLCKRAYVIESGEIVMKGPSEDILCDENVKCTYLGI
ncbi:MAG TPA: ABC transporter ATP-binding protein [Syntrophorhabdaceae bacterium]|nr:ABC transporter ATP-binding protein [Syntrophorhabdaceae bacterium]